jgi:hypothetical protein
MSNIDSYRRDLAFFRNLTNSRTAAASRLSFAGAMFVRTGSHCNCVAFTVPVIIQRALFSCTSILLICTLFNHTGAQYFAYYVNTSSNFLPRLRQMGVVCQRSIQCDTKVFGMINMLYLSISEIDVQHLVGIMRTEMERRKFWSQLDSAEVSNDENTHSFQPFEVSFKTCFTLRK